MAKRLLLVLLPIFALVILAVSLFHFRPVRQTASFELKVENEAKGIFLGREVEVPGIDLAAEPTAKYVLGENDPQLQHHIYVDLSSQTLRAFSGDQLIFEAKISSGRWGRTPTGEFTIWSKFRATRMSGGSGNDYYDLPNVPYTMFFSGPNAAAGRGFALHGAYWHNNFGYPMSHGCVNLRTIDAEKLFAWAEVNDPVTIYGETPI
jgi:hypothetical protein